jgi:hypothetical protein
MNAYISSEEPSPLSAKGMRDLTRQQLAGLMNLPLVRERPHETLGPAVIVGEEDPVAIEIVELLLGVLTETGKILVEKGYESLGAFVLDALRDGAKLEPGHQADSIVEAASLFSGALLHVRPTVLKPVVPQVVRTFPAFRDGALIDEKPVYVFKKALFLVHGICICFNSPDREPPPFVVPSTNHLPVFCDNVLSSMFFELCCLYACGKTLAD